MENDGSANPGLSDGPDDHVLTYIAVGEKGGVVFTRMMPAVSLKKDIVVAEAPGKKGGHRNLAGILKAVLLETSLAKKLRKRKHRQQVLRRSNSYREIVLPNSMREHSFHRRTVSNVSSTLRSSSGNTNTTSTALCSLCSSSVNSNSTFSRSNPAAVPNNIINVHQDVQKGQQQHHYSTNSGLCLLLTSLFVLVFWGKICAIFCTSTWLFFIPRWNVGHHANGAVKSLPETADLAEHRKKVIIEGWNSARAGI